MKRLVVFVFALIFLSPGAQAKVPESINLIFEDRVLNLNFTVQSELIENSFEHHLTLGNTKIPIKTDQKLLQEVPDLFAIETEFSPKISAKKLREFFESSAILKDLEKNTVEILLEKKESSDEKDHEEEFEIVFEGTPSYGYDINFDLLVDMIDEALVSGKTHVRVPGEKVYSEVVVHPELAKRGIKEIIAIGESNFSGSSPERSQNVLAGANKFNGHVLKRGEIFSFNTILDSVEEEDGFVKELVIKGERTEKELGGGVCQVSTTAFRAAFNGGLPIHRRKNHSYAVPYYQPHGLDATIYLGQTDFRFKNDTPGDILIQTVVKDHDLSFVFYGTDDGREVISEGPFVSNYEPAPDPKVTYVSYLNPGDIEEVSPAHDGFTSEWIRTVIRKGRAVTKNFISEYRSWPARINKGRKRISRYRPST